MSPEQHLYAEAVITESFPKDFAIFDLPKLLNVVGVMKDPEYVFEDDYLVVKSGRLTNKLVYSSPTLIKSPPEKKLDLGKAKISFVITNEDLVALKKEVAFMSLPQIVIIGDGEKIVMAGRNTKDETSDDSVVDVNVPTDKKFCLIFNQQSFQFIPGDYDVEVFTKAACFTNKKYNLKYWLAIQKGSTLAE
jgi:hypothetical protein